MLLTSFIWSSYEMNKHNELEHTIAINANQCIKCECGKCKRKQFNSTIAIIFFFFCLRVENVFESCRWKIYLHTNRLSPSGYNMS